WRAAGCRARSCGSRRRDAPGRTPAIASTTSFTADCTRATEDSAVTSQREQGETVAVEVVADHEAGGELAPLDDAGAVLFADAVTGEAATGERFLVPGSVRSLPIDEDVRPAGCRLAVGAPRRDQAKQRPCRLRRRALAAAACLD